MKFTNIKVCRKPKLCSVAYGPRQTRRVTICFFCHFQFVLVRDIMCFSCPYIYHRQYLWEALDILVAPYSKRIHHTVDWRNWCPPGKLGNTRIGPPDHSCYPKGMPAADQALLFNGIPFEDNCLLTKEMLRNVSMTQKYEGDVQVCVTDLHMKTHILCMSQISLPEGVLASVPITAGNRQYHQHKYQLQQPI